MIFNRTYLGYESPAPTGPDYLCFTSPNAFSVGMSKVGEPTIPLLEYSKDKTTWTTFTAGTTIVSANANEKVYLRGNNEYINTNIEDVWSFALSGTDVRASGNIMSLLDSTCESTTLDGECCLYGLFEGCTSLTTAPMLPATILKFGCYGAMFYGCTSLAAAPALPATTLASYCYYCMFTDCTSLTTAPVLSATTLASCCCEYMFSGCISLVVPPSLPATTLVIYCYFYMFENCTSLTTAPTLPATTLASGCYSNMFCGCTSLATAPALSATTLADGCYGAMFADCTALTTVPRLPATVLASGCYDAMFTRCTSLQVYSLSGEGHMYAWAIPTSGTASEYTTQYRMFYGTTGDYESTENVILNQTFYTQNEPV